MKSNVMYRRLSSLRLTGGKIRCCCKGFSGARQPQTGQSTVRSAPILAFVSRITRCCSVTTLSFIAQLFLAGIAFAQVPPPTQATASGEVKVLPNQRGSITGRVLGEDGQPLVDVGVSVSSLSGGRGTSRTIATDEEGNFKVNDLPVGAYSVMPYVPGFVNAQGADGQVSSNAPRYRLGENVTITMTKGGAITGKVLDSGGQPLVGAQVWAIRVRDGEGRSITESSTTLRPSVSDDRGIYRIYGLRAGSYVVYTVGAGEAPTHFTSAREVATYYPTATRDTAQEVSVAAGLEVQGIDIRHRGELGHAVSGTIVSAIETSQDEYVFVELLHLATGTRVAVSQVLMRMGNGFAMFGVPDGEYEITAQQQIFNSANRNESSGFVSTPRRVTVKGGDVTGLELRLVALSSMAGRVMLEKLEKTDCQITRRGMLEEVLLLPRRDDKETRHGLFIVQDTTPDDKGEFVVRALEAGRYRLNPQLPSDHWYVKAMNLAGAAAARASTTRAAAARTLTSSFAASGVTLKGGEKLTGLTITLAEGAAGLSGRVEGTKLPARLRVHVMPAEKEAADDVLRYSEVVTRDGTFAIRHLAPGKYWLVARALPEDESEEKPAKPVAWDTAARAALRREAQANNAIELTPCQRVKDYVLRFAVGK